MSLVQRWFGAVLAVLPSSVVPDAWPGRCKVRFWLGGYSGPQHHALLSDWSSRDMASVVVRHANQDQIATKDSISALWASSTTATSTLYSDDSCP
jgi:hypothetical protein